MKKIIKPGVREEAEYVCDVTGRPAVATLRMVFGYPSRHDAQALEADLSDEVAEEILALLQSRYPQFRLRDGNLIPRVEMHALPPAVLQTLAALANRRKRRKAAPARRKASK